MSSNSKLDFDSHQPEDKYVAAQIKVKRLKGFYTHLMIYILVNILIVFLNSNDLAPGESYFKMENFFTAFFWGIGVLVHGLSVFGGNIFFGKNWEDKKIKELMEKEKSEKWE
jgi:hypothetical protein